MSREQVLKQINNLPDSSWNKLLEFINQLEIKNKTRSDCESRADRYSKFFSYVGRINLDSDYVTYSREISKK